MKLSIKNRLIISDMVVQQGNLTEMIVSKSIREKIAISSDEAQKVEMKDVPTRDGKVTVNWVEEKDPLKDVVFNKLELEMLEKQATLWDKEKKITFGNMDTVMKFLPKTVLNKITKTK